MSRLENRSFPDYGLPAREAFGRSFWVGAGMGLMALSVLLAGIRLVHGFYFGSLALGTPGQRGLLRFHQPQWGCQWTV